MLKLEDFSGLKVSNPTRLKGGLVGRCVGSSIVGGTTYADMQWDNGTTQCGSESGISFTNDGSTDGLVGYDFVK